MIVLGMAESADDVRLWEESGVRSCVDPTFTDGECSGFISGVLDTGREISSAVWANAIQLCHPKWLFSPVLYDGGELGTYQDKVSTHIRHPGAEFILRVGRNAVLETIGVFKLERIALHGSDWDGGWDHWLLKKLAVWLVGGKGPRHQWLTWLELTHWGVNIEGIILDPPSKCRTHHLDPSSLGTTVTSGSGDVCGQRNSRVMAAFWEQVLDE